MTTVLRASRARAELNHFSLYTKLGGEPVQMLRSDRNYSPRQMINAAGQQGHLLDRV
jgi:hypothetical protein